MQEGEIEMKCKHEELEWVGTDNLCLGCKTCNGLIEVNIWTCVDCGKTGTTKEERHQASESCNPIEWGE